MLPIFLAVVPAAAVVVGLIAEDLQALFAHLHAQQSLPWHRACFPQLWLLLVAWVTEGRCRSHLFLTALW